MRLLLLRHGFAENTPLGLSDGARALTAAGVDDVRVLGRTLRARAEPLDLILCSSLVRAVQTAQIVSEALAFDGPMQVLGDLVPGGDPISAVEIARATGRSAVLLVGHEPQMSAMATYALGRPDVEAFRPGMLVSIDLPAQGKGTLGYVLQRDRELELPID